MPGRRAHVLMRSMAVRGSRPGKPVHLEEYEIKYLCLKARDIFINQPILLELEAPIKICGECAHQTLVTKATRRAHAAGRVRAARSRQQPSGTLPSARRSQC